jgi:hypothetical protein
LDVVIDPGLAAQRIAHIGQPDVQIPMQPQIQTAIARLLTDLLGPRLGAVVRQDHAPAPSTGVARDEVAWALTTRPECGWS